MLAAAGGLRLALLATLASASGPLSGRRASRALAGGLLTATAIAVIGADRRLPAQQDADGVRARGRSGGARPRRGRRPGRERAGAAEGDYSERESTNQPAYRYLAAHHVHVRYTPSYFALTHQKTLTVDGDVAVIMTLNFDGSYATTRDFAIIDRQPADVHAILATFNADYADGKRLRRTASGTSSGRRATASAVPQQIDCARRSIDLENEEMDSRRRPTRSAPPPAAASRSPSS